MRPGRFKDLVQWQKISGQPLSVNGLTLVPQSRLFVVRFPGRAFIWHRPTAVLIEQNGQTQVLPIVDRTRTIQGWLFGLSVVIIIIASFVQSSQRKEKAS